MTRDEAHAALIRLAAGVRELDEAAAQARLLERVAASDEPELRAALVEVGVRALLQEARRA